MTQFEILHRYQSENRRTQHWEGMPEAAIAMVWDVQTNITSEMWDRYSAFVRYEIPYRDCPVSEDWLLRNSRRLFIIENAP